MSKPMSDTADSTVDSLISVNDLDYVMKSDLSCVQKRTFTKQFPTSSSYGSSNREASIIFQTGSAFVGECFLRFKVKVTNGADGVSNAQTSLVCGTDLIQQVVLFSRDGTELSRIIDVNLLARQRLNYECTQGKMDSKNSMFYLPVSEQKFAPGDDGDTKEVVIPMAYLNGLFDYSSKKLLPSVLCAGLRMQITFETPEKAFTSANGTATYNISNMYIQTCEYHLTDSISLKLNESAARAGLEIVIDDYWTGKYAVGSTSFNIEARKACSRAMSVMMVPQLATTPDSDSMSASSTYPFLTSQVKVGNVYLPQSVVSSQLEMYYYTLKNFEHHFTDSTCGTVNLASFKTGGKGVYAQSLERSNIQGQLSGVSTNNSRSIQLAGTLINADPDRKITVFLKHLKVIRCFLNNTVVEE